MQQTSSAGRVEMWRGDVRLSMSVPAPFVWRCLSGSAVAPFPHPAHRTGRADFPHPDKTSRRLSRATPSAASEPHLELLGFPISVSFTTCCVCLELRPLPSTRVTRFPRYYEPLRHPRAPGLSLTGVRGPVIPDLTTLGAPRVARAFLVYVLPPLPRCSGWASSSLISPSRINLPR
jgi:hypothetical protein